MIDKKQILRIFLCLILAFSILLLTACGGGSNTSSNHSDANSLNGDFKGRLFISGNEDPWVMDFSTGRLTPIPGVLWEDNPDYFHKANFSANPAVYDGVEFIETVEKCRYSLDRLNDYDVCINIRDDQGRIISEFEMDYDTSGSARLSRDRQYFAIPLQKIGYSTERLTLFTRDGVIIDESDESDVKFFDWLPDNRLIYVNWAVDGTSMYITPSGSVTAKGSQILTFTDKGAPRDIAVSPDGSQLAFTWITHATVTETYGNVVVLDLESYNLRQLTSAMKLSDPNQVDDEPAIGDVAWSPDGRWIVVESGSAATGVGCLPSSGCVKTLSSVLYAVPSDGEKVILTTRSDITTSAVIINAYFDEANEYVDNPEISPEFDISFKRGGLSWLLE